MTFSAIGLARASASASNRHLAIRSAKKPSCTIMIWPAGPPRSVHQLGGPRSRTTGIVLSAGFPDGRRNRLWPSTPSRHRVDGKVDKHALGGALQAHDHILAGLTSDGSARGTVC